MSVELLEEHDAFAEARNRARYIAHAVGEWAGIPLPIDGESLTIAPGYPFAEVLARTVDDDERDDNAWAAEHVRSRFWSRKLRSEVAIIREDDGRIRGVALGRTDPVTMQLRTLGIADVWGVEQEQKALMTLGTMISHRHFRQYLLTGSFLETSRRSGVVYLFRRLRPTVALTMRTKNDRIRVLCALCMHPIGYYDGTWAGSMCPTDDVIAHLSLMRGDEHMLWKRCNQHPPERPEAGL